jgi:hypothetical protein
VVQKLSQPDFVPCIKPDRASAVDRCSIYTTPSKGTKDDLRAGAELGIVATVGVIAGWLSGLGAFLGGATSIALFWLVLAVACMLEFRKR